jgi:hypothetical protein
MAFSDQNIKWLLTGAVAGVVVGLIHALIAGLVIAPLMTGTFFYSWGDDLIGTILMEFVRDAGLGAVIGGIGAFAAIFMVKQKRGSTQ